jgi:OOP family OmpA-OmpF porin
MKTLRFILGILTIAMASLTVINVTSADEITKEGYLLDSRNNLVKSGFGLCWHTGFWTPDMAILECDPDLVKDAQLEGPVAVPEEPVPVVITLRSDTLFEFDESIIRTEERKNLDDEVVHKTKEHPQIKLLLVTGHADRIGTEKYNQQLSQRRAYVVKEYLVEQGIEAARIETVAKGESEPVVSCDEVKGPVSGKNTKLVECLEPNRRVVVEIKNQ